MDRIKSIFLLTATVMLASACQSKNQPVDTSSAPSVPLFASAFPLPPADTASWEVAGTELFVRVQGQGPAVVVVHGGPGMSHDYLAPGLAYLSRGYRVVHYDQRLSGRSAPSCDPAQITMAQWVEDLEALRLRLGVDSMILVSHSWGSLVAMRYAATYPGHVAGLVFLHPVASDPALVQTASATLQNRLSESDQLTREKLVRSEAFQAGEPEALLAAYRFSFAQNIFRRAFLDSLALRIPDRALLRQEHLSRLYQDPDMQAYNYLQPLAAVQAPALVIHGSYDATPLEASRQLQEALPHAELVQIQDCGHFSFLETPKELAAVLEPFLSKCAAAKGEGFGTNLAK